ncbi:uncharacterized protein [Paralichthys olivaceus]|uniref:uncharacterized protein isoform X1 n=1 Tax=Paralichthys olivaceus TaxID=8255 RepID=UPI0037539E82
MACGIHLGTFLLICLFQAEHVRCSWATQALGSQRQNSNAYVGFLQKDSGLRTVGSNPQNKFRQASVSPGLAQSSILNPEPAVSSGYNQGFSSSGYTQTVSQPAHSGYASVRLAQSSSGSNPNWQKIGSKQVNAQSVPKLQFLGLSTAIASGSSLSKHSQNQNSLTDRRTWPTEQGTQRINQHPSRNSASAQNPAYSAQVGYAQSSRSSSLFSAEGPVPKDSSVRKHTSATARARRVSSRPKAAASKPSRFSVSQNEGTRNNPSQTVDGNWFQSKLFTVTQGSAQGGYKPASNMASSYPQSVAEPYKQNAAAFAPRSLRGSQGLNYDSSYTATEQMPSQTHPASLVWNTRNQEEGGLRVTGGSSQHFSPTRTHSIPHRFGGSPIRRLRGSSDQKQVVRTPQLKYMAPSQQTASYNPQVQSVHPENKWVRISKLHQ